MTRIYTGESPLHNISSFSREAVIKSIYLRSLCTRKIVNDFLPNTMRFD